MRYTGGHLSFKPFVPKGWTHYSFTLNYRGRLIAVDVADETTLKLVSGDPIDVLVFDETVHLS